MKKINSKRLPEEGVSHNPDIMKKVFIKKGEIPQLMMYGSAVFKPGDSVDLHKHETMYEVFHITKGKANFLVEGKEILVSEGDCITIEPNELHGQSNPFSENVEWTYFGIAID